MGAGVRTQIDALNGFAVQGLANIEKALANVDCTNPFPNLETVKDRKIFRPIAAGTSQSW